MGLKKEAEYAAEEIKVRKAAEEHMTLKAEEHITQTVKTVTVEKTEDECVQHIDNHKGNAEYDTLDPPKRFTTSKTVVKKVSTTAFDVSQLKSSSEKSKAD